MRLSSAWKSPRTVGSRSPGAGRSNGANGSPECTIATPSGVSPTTSVTTWKDPPAAPAAGAARTRAAGAASASAAASAHADAWVRMSTRAPPPRPAPPSPSFLNAVAARGRDVGDTAEFNAL